MLQNTVSNHIGTTVVGLGLSLAMGPVILSVWTDWNQLDAVKVYWEAD